MHSIPISAHQIEDDFIFEGFPFEDGQTLPMLRQHYTTLGVPLHNRHGHISNAVLLLHGTIGSGSQFLAPSFSMSMFGPGQPLDITTWFLILPDAIGHGASSKPSDELRTSFPRYTYTDIVHAQYRLVKEHLGIPHLRLVMGTSMGGMQTWMWGELYPQMMDGLLPMACEPAPIRGRNLLWRHIITHAIRTDPAWNDGNYQQQPQSFIAVWPLFSLMTGSPKHFQEHLPTLSMVDAAINHITQNARTQQDANDLLYGLEASLDYNPVPSLARIQAPLLAINFADDELNPPDLGILEREVPHVKRGRFVTIDESEQTRGHSTLNQATVYQSHVKHFLTSLPSLSDEDN